MKRILSMIAVTAAIAGVTPAAADAAACTTTTIGTFTVTSCDTGTTGSDSYGKADDPNSYGKADSPDSYGKS